MFLKQLLCLLVILLAVKNLYKGCYHLYTLEFGLLSTNSAELDYEYLEYLSDSVARENFTYYSFHNEGNFKLKLITTYGDADMYISANRRKPHFRPNEHDLSSTTCGVDVLELHEGIKRPAIVGIYGAGHTTHSNYTLYIAILDKVGKRDDGFNWKQKLHFVIRYTTMWRIFEILESILFVL